MASMKITRMSDDGYPTGRQLDGMNVKECASREGAMFNFGKIKRGRREWTNSKTGASMEKPEYADYDDDLPEQRRY